jgi:hypothetical protein
LPHNFIQDAYSQRLIGHPDSVFFKKSSLYFAVEWSPPP